MRITTADVLKLVPEFMRDDEAVKGLAAAVNELIREPALKVKTARVWDQLDELDDAQLDELAYELDIDWYSSGLPIDKKRAIIKISDLVHSRRGTKWAVEELIAAYISPGFVKEWHEDGYVNPQPYHFSVYTSHRNVTDEIIQEFRAIAKVAMSVRSRMDGVYFCDTFGSKTLVGSNIAPLFFTSKKCGTIPRAAVVGAVITEAGAIASNAMTAKAYKLTEPGDKIVGTYPRITTLGAVITAGAAATSNGSANAAAANKCGTNKCGE